MHMYGPEYYGGNGIVGAQVSNLELKGVRTGKRAQTVKDREQSSLNLSLQNFYCIAGGHVNKNKKKIILDIILKQKMPSDISTLPLIQPADCLTVMLLLNLP